MSDKKFCGYNFIFPWKMLFNTSDISSENTSMSWKMDIERTVTFYKGFKILSGYNVIFVIRFVRILLRKSILSCPHHDKTEARQEAGALPGTGGGVVAGALLATKMAVAAKALAIEMGVEAKALVQVMGSFDGWSHEEYLSAEYIEEKGRTFANRLRLEIIMSKTYWRKRNTLQIKNKGVHGGSCENSWPIRGATSKGAETSQIWDMWFISLKKGSPTDLKRIQPGKLLTERQAAVAFTSPTTYQSYKWIRCKMEMKTEITWITELRICLFA
ncbi:hypothetical protein Tco_0392676 [Tanacetum coccineum]